MVSLNTVKGLKPRNRCNKFPENQVLLAFFIALPTPLCCHSSDGLHTVSLNRDHCTRDLASACQTPAGLPSNYDNQKVSIHFEIHPPAPN